jgi:glyoxylase-like metal-dependent hydrolase (beta-lactamase superfamily II)
VRAVALHADVLLATSAIWQTNCVVVRSGKESFLIDSPVLPEELEALPTLVEQAGFPLPSGLLATHGDWDHLLGRLAFPGHALGCAETTAERLRLSPGSAQRELRAFDEEFLIERPRPLALGAVQALPVPGRCRIGEREIELHRAEGHTEEGMAVWIPWARTLLASDYLSAIELPSLSRARRDLAGGELGEVPAASACEELLDGYLATLERLQPIAREAEYLVPGHGPVLSAERALAVIAEDLAYLLALRRRGGEVELPAGRRSRTQRMRHAENLRHLKSEGG